MCLLVCAVPYVCHQPAGQRGRGRSVELSDDAGPGMRGDINPERRLDQNCNCDMFPSLHVHKISEVGPPATTHPLQNK